jgi:hypothetical protein
MAAQHSDRRSCADGGSRVVRWRVGVAAAWVVWAACPAFATDYHVAPPPLGSDSNIGSVVAPFATIQRAANVVNPGDTVIVHPGTYQGFNAGRSGTADAPITFRTVPPDQPGGGPVILNTAALEPFNGSRPKARINIDSASHIIIEGFEIVGAPDHRTSKSGIRIVCPPGGQGGSDFGFITIRRVNSHHNGQWGMLTGHVHHVTVEDSTFSDNTAEHGLYLSNSGDGHIVRRCTFRNNSSNGIHINADLSQGGDGIISGVLVERNIIINNGIGSTYTDGSGVARTVAGGGSGINGDGVRDSVIRNNVLFNNHASGISLYRIDGAQGAGDNLVVNNTIVQGSPANTAARWCLNIADASTGNVVFNNILLNYHGFRGSIFISADSRAGFVSDANLVMDRLDPDGDGPTPTLSLVQWRAQTGHDVHSRAVPLTQWAGLFADLAAGDVRLSAASLARDAGLALLAGREAPPNDCAGAPRPMNGVFDVGAYEFPDAAPCAADFDGSGELDPDDLSDYIACYFEAVGGALGGAGCPRADYDSDGDADPDDLSDYIAAYFAGCA